MITQNKPNWVNNPRKWIWMLVGFIIIEKFLENGILVPVLLKLPFGDLTSNILYKGIEVLLVLGLNIWLIKQKLYFSVNVTLKTTLFFLFGIVYISLFISSGPVKLLPPIILWTLLTAISEELLFRGSDFWGFIQTPHSASSDEVERCNCNWFIKPAVQFATFEQFGKSVIDGYSLSDG
ncbi:hypothetical protein [Lentilactobacillus buchneri]|uniref:hypothetical protein n=1 Tax=Lentilactobacillus buchneri TaxID=1581 RepID=UPI001CDB864D|nr:hypothetical protein [Lentilactobacillus buchneri]MCC6100781.1 hypothetical protein [Lactobacillus sp.]